MALQPISEDVKDGRRILVPVPGLDGPYDIVIVRWDQDPDDEGGQCWRTDDHERTEFEPTQYWSLPQGPTELFAGVSRGPVDERS